MHVHACARMCVCVCMYACECVHVCLEGAGSVSRRGLPCAEELTCRWGAPGVALPVGLPDRMSFRDGALVLSSEPVLGECSGKGSSSERAGGRWPWGRSLVPVRLVFPRLPLGRGRALGEARAPPSAGGTGSVPVQPRRRPCAGHAVCFLGCGLWPSGPTCAALGQELLQRESEPV